MEEILESDHYYYQVILNEQFGRGGTEKEADSETASEEDDQQANKWQLNHRWTIYDV